MELETLFYITAIVYMSLMLVLFVALFAAVLVVKARINRLHRMLDSKIGQAKSIAGKATIGVNALRYFVRK